MRIYSITDTPAGKLTSNFCGKNVRTYSFNSKELDDETGLYYFGARYYSPKLSIFLSADPLKEMYPGISPYAYCFNNPVRFGDPTGMAPASPIYGTDGTLLGTDEYGLKGTPIVMKKEDFKQGMSHEEAVSYSTYVPGESQYYGFDDKKAIDKYMNIQVNLENRPDYDGFVTISEGIAWAKAHPDALDSPTPGNSLYLDASKLNFGSLSVADMQNLGFTEGAKGNVNLFNYADFLSESSRATTYALGNTQIKLIDSQKGTVQLFWDDYNWDVHPEGNKVRNALIRAERVRAGLDDSHGFRVYMYGTGTLK